MKLQNKDVLIGIVLVTLAALSAVISINISSRIFVGTSVLLIYVCFLIGILTKDIKNSLLFLLALIGPFEIQRYFTYNGELNLWVAVNIIDLLLVLLYSLWLIEKIGAKTSKINLFKDCTLPLLGLLFASILSVINSVDKISWFYHTALLARGILIFYYISNNVKTKKTLKIIIIMFLVGIAFQSLIAVIQELKGGVLGLEYIFEPRTSWFEELEGTRSIYRVTGTFPSHNHFCFMYLEYLLPLFISLLLLKTPMLAKIGISIIFATAIFALIFTLSRGGWLSFTVGSISFFLLYSHTRRFNPRTFFLFFLIICLLAVPFIFLKDIVLSRLLVDNGESLTMRLPLMQIAIAIILSHLFLGIGMGNYLQVMHLYDVTRMGITSFFFYEVHNLYLLIAAEIGIFGLACFLLFLLSVSKRALYTIKSDNRFTSLISIGLFSGLIASMFHGFFESISLGRIIMLWIVTGLIVSLNKIVRNSRDIRNEHA